MKATLRSRTRKWGMMLVATLSGGTTFVSCETRLRQDLVDGTKLWIYSLLDPSLYINTMIDTTPTDQTGQ